MPTVLGSQPMPTEYETIPQHGPREANRILSFINFLFGSRVMVQPHSVLGHTSIFALGTSFHNVMPDEQCMWGGLQESGPTPSNKRAIGHVHLRQIKLKIQQH